MAECRLETHEKAHMVFQLMEKAEEDGGDYPLGYYVEAAKDYKDIDEALKYLIKPCPICECQYPVHEVSWPLPLHPDFFSSRMRTEKMNLGMRLVQLSL